MNILSLIEVCRKPRAISPRTKATERSVLSERETAGFSLRSFIKKLFFYRQHPDAALRYLPIVKILKKNRWDNLNILEVGSGSYGIAPYLKKKITGVDLFFDEPNFPLLERIKGSAVKLPFNDKQFDIVLLSDVLEHLPRDQRKKALGEAVRVGMKAVIIGGPFGSRAAEQDRELAQFSKKKLGRMHKFFIDHLKFGLPEISDIKSYLKNNPGVKGVQVEGQYLNLDVRSWIMKFFISDNKIVYYFYLKGLMYLVPLFRYLNKKPCYRSIILIKL